MAITDEIKRLRLGESVETIVKNADDNFISLFDTVDDLDEIIQGVLNASQAMVFKGTLGKTNGTVASLPTTGYSSGDTYQIVDANTYAGKKCEVGDIIICLYDYTDESKPSNSDDHWTVVQGNIDGAVTGPTSSVDGHVAVFSGTGGNMIADSGFTVDQIGKVKDVKVNNVSKLDEDTGIVNITIDVEALESEYTSISANSLVTKTVNDTDYYAIKVVETDVPLEVYNSNGDQLLTHTVRDGGYLYICVGTTQIACTLRKVGGSAVGGSGGSSSEPVYQHNIAIAFTPYRRAQTDGSGAETKVERWGGVLRFTYLSTVSGPYESFSEFVDDYSFGDVIGGLNGDVWYSVAETGNNAEVYPVGLTHASIVGTPENVLQVASYRINTTETLSLTENELFYILREQITNFIDTVSDIYL